jgi:AmmeMemoRadiSam system protein B/AmmeMemoRadiSam system protein A
MTQTHWERAIRPAAVAGMFYPADPGELRSIVDRLLANSRESFAGSFNARAINAEAFAHDMDKAATPTPKALIVPHAGYVYSGAAAAAAYRSLSNARGKISRVVLLGPSHRFAFAGMATTFARGFETPLGVVPVDDQWLDQARDFQGLGILDEAHEGEHCLETQLPFLQRVLGDFKLIPIICGRVSSDQVADLLDKLWGGPETIIVVSSDLSHYLDYQACRVMDAMTCAAIERLDTIELTLEQACGAAPVNGLLAAARRRGMRVETLDLRNSGDTAGPRDRVVGYGAWGFWEQDAAIELGEDVVRRHGVLMNDVARHAISGGASPPLEKLPAAFRRTGACFVTLHKAGALRGCCGSVMAWRPLVEDIRANAVRSAFDDPRFVPLEGAERDDVSLTVTLLSSLQPMSIESEADLLSKLQPHRDGLLIEDAGQRALFLPAVWKMLPDKQEFLAHLKAKAGLSLDHWSPTFRASRFLTMQTLEEKLGLAWSEDKLLAR